jgi:hypothetical protein
MPDTVSALARKFAVDINTGTTLVPVWTRIGGMMEFNDPLNPTLEDDSDYDSGWGSVTKTQLKYQLVMKIVRRHNPDDVTEYDAGQEALRTRSTAFGGDGWADVRWYDREGGPEAYRGTTEVTWQRAGGPTTALDTVTVTLDGKGERTDITNPLAGS